MSRSSKDKKRAASDYASPKYATQKGPIKASGDDKRLLKAYKKKHGKKLKDAQEKAFKKRKKAYADG